MNNACKECGRVFADESVLHRHIKAHKLTISAYYYKYYPRFDKYDGKLIQFKNREYYLTSDFNSRANLSAWFNRVGPAESKQYVRAFLESRKTRKNLIYAPTQVELRSLLIPGLSYINHLFGDYYKLCQELGFKLKHTQYKFRAPLSSFLKFHKIFCDTREQLPLSFSIPTETIGLKFGDYRLNDDDFTRKLVIERKTLEDFYGTLTKDKIRFLRELDRAKEQGFYLIVLVESPFNSMHLLSERLASLNIFIKPEYVQHSMREVSQSYPDIQFLFVANRQEASKTIETLFQSNGEYRHVDLQYLYDIGQL